MPRLLLIPLIALPLALLACGSSEPSEQDAADLLSAETAATQPSCAKDEGASRNFTCEAQGKNGKVEVRVRVAESSESIIVTDCEAASTATEEENEFLGFDSCAGID